MSSSQPEPTSLVKGRRAMSPSPITPRSMVDRHRKQREPSTPTTADSAPRRRSTRRHRRYAPLTSTRLASGGSRETMQVSSLMLPRTLRPLSGMSSSPLINLRNSATHLRRTHTPESLPLPSKHFSRPSAAPTVDSSCKPKASPLAPGRKLFGLAEAQPQERVLVDVPASIHESKFLASRPLRQASVPPPSCEPPAIIRLLSAGHPRLNSPPSPLPTADSPICRPQPAPADLCQLSTPQPSVKASEIWPSFAAPPPPSEVTRAVNSPPAVQRVLHHQFSTYVDSQPPRFVHHTPILKSVSITKLPSPLMQPHFACGPNYQNPPRQLPTRVMAPTEIPNRRWGIASLGNESHAKSSFEEVAALTTIAAPSIGGHTHSPREARRVLPFSPPPAHATAGQTMHLLTPPLAQPSAQPLSRSLIQPSAQPLVKSIERAAVPLSQVQRPSVKADDEMSLRDVILRYLPRPPAQEHQSVPLIVGHGRLPMAIPENLECDSISGYLVPQGATHQKLTRQNRRRRPRNPFCIAC